jgi:Ca2+-binding RTX toxin-like protein
MAWSDVEAKIKFWGPDGEPEEVNGIPAAGYGTQFSPADKTAILNALHDLYDNSPKAQALLEEGVAIRDIWLLKNTATGADAGSGAFPNSGTASIDMRQAETLRWMGRDGRFQLENLGGNVIHELVHAIKGFRDLLSNDFNAANFDHIGQTQTLTNEILQEARYPFGYWQVGYAATFDVSPSIFRTDISYTEDNSIDIAYFDRASNKTPDVLDLSLRTDSSKDLIIGLGGDDRINGGAGRDYLYGGVGDDTISGGSGDDVLHGGDRKTAIDALRA